MGDSLAKEGNYQAAQAAYEAAIRNDDTLARAYHRLALITERTGKGGDANQLFQRAVQLDPKNAEIVCDYGYYCYLRQDWSGALTHFERALQLDPNLKRAHNNMGLVYARTGRPDHALRQFAMSGLSDADARANLGFVYLTQKRFQEAKAELQVAANTTPASTRARDILARFDKIETSAQPQQAEPPQAQPVAASAPAAPPSVREQFDITPIAAEVPRPQPTAPSHAVEETARPEAPQIQRLAALAPVPTKQQAPTPTVANNPPVDLPTDQPTAQTSLPTQHLAPVLSDYQF